MIDSGGLLQMALAMHHLSTFVFTRFASFLPLQRSTGPVRFAMMTGASPGDDGSFGLRWLKYLPKSAPYIIPTSEVARP